MADPVLEIHDLSFAYPGVAPLFTAWSATVPAGVTLLFGDTGSGKTTLLKLMAGSLPASGRLTLAGVRLDTDRATYQRNVFHFDPTDDAFDQVSARACTAALSAGDERFDAVAWQAMVDGFALAPHLDKPMYMLSSGSKRKVGLAAALASGRMLILLDEPTATLDAPSIEQLTKRLAVLAVQEERCIIVASCERPKALLVKPVILLSIGFANGLRS